VREFHALKNMFLNHCYSQFHTVNPRITRMASVNRVADFSNEIAELQESELQ